MPRRSKADAKPEFRRYRQGLQIATFGTTACIVAWLLASVAHSLFAHPAVRPSATFSGRSDDVGALLDCQADVESLFDDLNRKLFDLQALGAKYDIEEGQQWEGFSKQWLRRRREVGARCRFDELSGHGLGAAYDHLAVVYGELEEVQRAYAVLLNNYLGHLALRVNDIRHTLESSRKTFEQQRAARGAGTRAG